MKERRLRLLFKLGLISPASSDLVVMVVDGAFSTAALRQLMGDSKSLPDVGLDEAVENMTRAEQAALVASVRGACPSARAA